ncbi:LysR family transcriptional regulator [Nocardia sp. NPDC127579]|uniref:LysR family transcriptional regulator n=1 Tax=Nocardia sp. NPDC127579 TaxID=3345402 RepID=UPI00363DD63C
MDLDQLRTALALSRHRTVNRTAAALGLAPSSVSDRIRRLETELGAPLFLRDHTGMHPTGIGAGYLRAAAAALGTLDQAAEMVRAAPGFTVGAQASIANELLPAILDELRVDHPDIQVRLRPETDRGRLLEALERGDLDAVVLLDTGARVGDLGFPTPTTPLEFLDVREVAMTVVVAPGHPLLGHPVSMDEIHRAGSLIGREPRCAFWMATQHWLGPDVDLTAVGGLAQVRDWVATGRGIALLPTFAVRSDLDSDRLAAVDIPAPPLGLRLVWRENHDTPDRLRPLLYALSRA